jgi:hypothetical protein
MRFSYQSYWTGAKDCEFLRNRSNFLSDPAILLEFSQATKNLSLPSLICKCGRPNLARRACPPKLVHKLVEVLLSKGQVEQTLSGVGPETGREVYVEVNAKQYPIKQVLATATGCHEGDARPTTCGVSAAEGTFAARSVRQLRTGRMPPRMAC